MKKLTNEQRLEGYLDFEREGLGPPNLMSFLQGIAFAEEHYLKDKPVAKNATTEPVVSSKMEPPSLKDAYIAGQFDASSTTAEDYPERWQIMDKDRMERANDTK